MFNLNDDILGNSIVTNKQASDRRKWILKLEQTLKESGKKLKYFYFRDELTNRCVSALSILNTESKTNSIVFSYKSLEDNFSKKAARWTLLGKFLSDIDVIVTDWSGDTLKDIIKTYNNQSSKSIPSTYKFFTISYNDVDNIWNCEMMYNEDWDDDENRYDIAKKVLKNNNENNLSRIEYEITIDLLKDILKLFAIVDGVQYAYALSTISLLMKDLKKTIKYLEVNEI